MISIVEIKREIYKIQNRTKADERVLAIVDSFCGCSDNWIKGNLCRKIAKYAGCKAWKIAMDSVYMI